MKLVSILKASLQQNVTTSDYGAAECWNQI
jgi:hypothetical protein